MSADDELVLDADLVDGVLIGADEGEDDILQLDDSIVDDLDAMIEPSENEVGTSSGKDDDDNGDDDENGDGKEALPAPGSMGKHKSGSSEAVPTKTIPIQRAAFDVDHSASTTESSGEPLTKKAAKKSTLDMKSGYVRRIAYLQKLRDNVEKDWQKSQTEEQKAQRVSQFVGELRKKRKTQMGKMESSRQLASVAFRMLKGGAVSRKIDSRAQPVERKSTAKAANKGENGSEHTSAADEGERSRETRIPNASASHGRDQRSRQRERTDASKGGGLFSRLLAGRLAAARPSSTSSQPDQSSEHPASDAADADDNSDAPSLPPKRAKGRGLRKFGSRPSEPTAALAPTPDSSEGAATTTDENESVDASSATHVNEARKDKNGRAHKGAIVCSIAVAITDTIMDQLVVCSCEFDARNRQRAMEQKTRAYKMLARRFRASPFAATPTFSSAPEAQPSPQLPRHGDAGTDGNPSSKGAGHTTAEGDHCDKSDGTYELAACSFDSRCAAHELLNIRTQVTCLSLKHQLPARVERRLAQHVAHLMHVLCGNAIEPPTSASSKESEER